MKSLRSFKEYIKEKFADRLFNEIQSYVDYNFELLNLEVERVSKIDEIEVYDINIKSVRVFDDKNWMIKFDIIVAATLLIKGHHYSEGQDDFCEKWFMFSCSGNLNKKLNDFKIINLSEYSSMNNYVGPMTDSLIPYIKNDEFEKYAIRILKKIYPEALQNPINIDTENLVKRIGLNVLLRSISADGTVFGQLFFKGCEAELYDKEKKASYKEHIPARTILIDQDASFLYSFGTKNMTIVHECVHFLLHSKAFAFARLYDRSLTKLRCLVEGGQKETFVDSKTTYSMEYQANTLAPKILMPFYTFKRKAQELIEKNKKELDKTETIDVLENVINELADFYGVSRLAAKIRMIEVGYEEAVGTFNYIDGKYVRPHKYKKGAIARDQTFCISMKDAAILMLTNPELHSRCLAGEYIFVDSHLVVNEPKYVYTNEKGNVKLTNYARYHMDECCLYFDIVLKKDMIQEASYHTICVLNRDIKTPFQYNIVFHNGYQHSIPEKQKAYLLNAVREEEALFKQMPNDYLECLKIVKEKRKVTYMEIAEEINMDERSVRRIFKGESNSTIETLVAICLALHLPPKVSEHIINISPLSFNQQEEKHLLYQFALKALYGHSMEQIREQLSQYGVEL